jgi:hypothetical protein
MHAPCALHTNLVSASRTREVTRLDLPTCRSTHKAAAVTISDRNAYVPAPFALATGISLADAVRLLKIR